MPARLPDLVVIGAPKAGTTTLTHWLRTHPGVAFSAVKELEFFDRRFDRGLPWYLEQLPSDPGDRCVVEATPTYLSDPDAPGRMAHALPHARFVAVLREPVARAWSQYWFFVQLGLERRSWAQALAQEIAGRPEALDIGYLWRGRYGAQLTHWDALVAQERRHVLLTDDLASDPVAAYAGVCRFAGLEAREPPGRTSVNPTRLPRSRRLQRALQSPEAGRARRAAYVWNARGRVLPALPIDEHARWAPLFDADLTVLEERIGRRLPPRWRPSLT